MQQMLISILRSSPNATPAAMSLPVPTPAANTLATDNVSTPPTTTQVCEAASRLLEYCADTEGLDAGENDLEGWEVEASLGMPGAEPNLELTSMQAAGCSRVRKKYNFDRGALSIAIAAAAIRTISQRIDERGSLHNSMSMALRAENIDGSVLSRGDVCIQQDRLLQLSSIAKKLSDKP